MTDHQTLNHTGFIKTILMLLVFVDHACAFWTGAWFADEPAISSQELGLLSSLLGSFHVYAFALVSGYLFTYRLRKGGYEAWLPFLRKKAKRLILPYLFATPLWVAPVSAYFFQWDFSRLFMKYVLCVNPSQLWFLWMLFDVFAMVWPLKALLLKSPRIGWAAAMALYCVGLAGKRFLPNVFCIWTACQYVPFFYAGMRIRQKEERAAGFDPISGKWFVWLIAFTALLAAVLFTGRRSDARVAPIHSVLEFFLHLVGAVSAFAALRALSSRVPWQKSKLFQALSSYAMPMYLFHQQIIYFSIRWLNGRVTPWLNAGINFLMAFFGSFLISALLMRWPAARKLMGETSAE